MERVNVSSKSKHRSNTLSSSATPTELSHFPLSCIAVQSPSCCPRGDGNDSHMITSASHTLSAGCPDKRKGWRGNSPASSYHVHRFSRVAKTDYQLLSASKSGMDKPIGVGRVWQGAANPSPEIFFLVATPLKRGKQKKWCCSVRRNVCVCIYIYIYIYTTEHINILSKKKCVLKGCLVF